MTDYHQNVQQAKMNANQQKKSSYFVQSPGSHQGDVGIGPINFDQVSVASSRPGTSGQHSNNAGR